MEDHQANDERPHGNERRYDHSVHHLSPRFSITPTMSVVKVIPALSAITQKSSGWPWTRLGPYEIVAEIGTGDMGEKLCRW